jgi:hypothetical protein
MGQNPKWGVQRSTLSLRGGGKVKTATPSSRCLQGVKPSLSVRTPLSHSGQFSLDAPNWSAG